MANVELKLYNENLREGDFYENVANFVPTPQCLYDDTPKFRLRTFYNFAGNSPDGGNWAIHARLSAAQPRATQGPRGTISSGQPNGAGPYHTTTPSS
jgi:hypothetical protein